MAEKEDEDDEIWFVDSRPMEEVLKEKAANAHSILEDALQGVKPGIYPSPTERWRQRCRFYAESFERKSLQSHEPNETAETRAEVKLFLRRKRKMLDVSPETNETESRHANQQTYYIDNNFPIASASVSKAMVVHIYISWKIVISNYLLFYFFHRKFFAV
eukprot:m.85291 g.85291  ORF g.85291 m.85291 type:complete len:160 (+) comp13002_c0_seq2:149-628(+)